MTMLFATDIRVASEHATFGLSEVKRGIIAGNGGTQRTLQQLPWCIGMEMLLTGDAIDAATAARWGLINKVVPHSELMTAARDYAKHRRQRAACGAGRQRARGALTRHRHQHRASHRAADRADAARDRGRQGRAGGVPREAQAELQGQLSMARQPVELKG